MARGNEERAQDLIIRHSYTPVLCLLRPRPAPPEKFENAALFLRLGLPSTLIRPENGALRKRWGHRSR